MASLQIFRQFIFPPAPGSKRGSVSKLSGWKAACTIFLFSTATAITAAAQTFTPLASFNGTNGSWPVGVLTQGTDGNIYGTTGGGGADYPFFEGGTVFRVGPNGTVTTLLYSFCLDTDCADGYTPIGGLVQATDGNFYGTTTRGGLGAFEYDDGGHGTIFRITRGGKLTTLHDFNDSAGSHANSLMQADDGNFYGTTPTTDWRPVGCTIFKITPSGKFTNLPGCLYSPLVQATDGNLYGTDGGSVLKITPSGTVTTLRSVNGFPNSLMQAADGNFYGTTVFGGAYGSGSVFKITPGGKLTTLHSFNGADGTVYVQNYYVLAPALVQATDGNFYGTTLFGGPCSGGEVFTITPGGKLTILHAFCGDSYTGPAAGLVQATNGDFYGTTAGGGTGNGTIFRLSMGLGPFVRFIRNSGKVGQTAQILGQGFTGTTGVSFNGTPATFTVKSDTYLTAIVPAGATTGHVTVNTPGGTLKSNKIFRVTPQILSFSPMRGPVGTSVVITGESLTGANAVVFECNNKPATFTVDSDTQITAIVPTGATGGRIFVHTPGGGILSAYGFGVTP